MKLPNQDRVVKLYLEGVEAIERITASADGTDWSKPACGEWTAAETARHLVGVIDWYSHWLDRAIEGESTRPFAEAEIDARNSAAIAELGDLDGPEAIERFGAGARSYSDRAQQHWDLPYSYPFGVVTVGLHLGIAATEWHLHAWDLSVGDTKHEPTDAAALFTAAGAAVVTRTGGLKGRLLGLVIPLAAKRSPWATLVKKSGRR